MSFNAIAVGIYLGLVLAAVHVAVYGSGRRLASTAAFGVLAAYVATVVVVALAFLGNAPTARFYGALVVGLPWRDVLTKTGVADGTAIWLGAALNLILLSTVAIRLARSRAVEPRASRLAFLRLNADGRRLVYIALFCLVAIPALTWLLTFYSPYRPFSFTSATTVFTYLPNPYDRLPDFSRGATLVLILLLIARRIWRLVSRRDLVPSSFDGLSLLAAEAAVVLWASGLIFMLLSRERFASLLSPEFYLLIVPAAFMVPVAFVIAELRSFRRAA